MVRYRKLCDNTADTVGKSPVESGVVSERCVIGMGQVPCRTLFLKDQASEWNLLLCAGWYMFWQRVVTTATLRREELGMLGSVVSVHVFL